MEKKEEKGTSFFDSRLSLNSSLNYCTNATKQIQNYVVNAGIEGCSYILNLMSADSTISFTDEDTSQVIISGKEYNVKDNGELKRAIKNHFWFTYRTGFAPIGQNMDLIRDTGWGCMIRCGQMMLAESLRRHYLPRDFDWSQNTLNGPYRNILNLFADTRSSAFSIHQIVLMRGNTTQMDEWFGPNTIAQVLKRLSVYSHSPEICICVALDHVVIIEDILNEWHASKQKAEKDDIPLLLIIPLRLGVHVIDEQYRPIIKDCLAMSSSVGLIGGKPKHALYFIGTTGDHLLYMDPHFTQEYVDISSNIDDSSFHTDEVRWTHFNQLDPSIALGFTCADEDEFEDLTTEMKTNLLSHSKPLFEIHAKSIFYNVEDDDLNVVALSDEEDNSSD